jgi:hypothetical protein
MPAAKKTTGRTRTTPASSKRALSAAHKRALAEGRTMSANVDRYLSAVNTPKARGRRVSKSTLEQRLVSARTRAKAATGLDKLLASQKIRDLQSKIAELESTRSADLPTLEASFVKIAKKFGEKRGIGYGAWRDAGVPPQVLKRAGIARTRG